MKPLTCLLGLLLMTTPIIANTYVYVSVGEEDRIEAYQQDTAKGTLTSVASVKVEGGPGSLAVDPKKQFLFAALRNSKKVGSYLLDKDGALTGVGSTFVGINPVYVATDRTGKYLLASSYGEGKVISHAIDANGKIGAEAISSHDTAKNAHSILPDRSNRFVFVPHTGPNAIFQFLLDAKTGKLTPNEMVKVTADKDQEPRHLWFHPKKDIVYLANEKNGSVTAYQLDTAKGLLKAIQSLSTLPKDFKGKNSCAHVEMTPNGKFLYVSNRGHDSLARYAADEDTGKLTALGQTPTEATPRAFAIDPTGQFLYAAGQSSGKLAAYRIDQKTGDLKNIATYEVGKGPAWVTIVTLAN